MNTDRIDWDVYDRFIRVMIPHVQTYAARRNLFTAAYRRDYPHLFAEVNPLFDTESANIFSNRVLLLIWDKNPRLLRPLLHQLHQRAPQTFQSEVQELLAWFALKESRWQSGMGAHSATRRQAPEAAALPIEPEELPDWLIERGGVTAPAESEPGPAVQSPEDDDLFDEAWLSESTEEPDVGEWVGRDQSRQIRIEDPGSESSESDEEGELPDWLSEIEEGLTPDTEAGLSGPIFDEDDDFDDAWSGEAEGALAWLEELSQESEEREPGPPGAPTQSTREDDSVVEQRTPTERDELPDWLAELEEDTAAYEEPSISAMAQAPAETAAQAPPPQEEKPLEKRVINVQLKDWRTDRKFVNPAREPLFPALDYVLSFYVDRTAHKDSMAASEIDPFKDRDKEKETITLTVQLQSQDFDIDPNVQNLMVPRTGRSNKIHFTIVPRHEGDALISVIILKDGAFVQLMNLKFKVGGELHERLFESQTMGRSIDDAKKLKPRDVHLTINHRNGYYHLTISGSVSADGIIPITRQHLNQMITRARNELQKVVYFDIGGLNIYQSALHIPAKVRQESLIDLARVGWRLYNKIFYGPGHDQQIRLIGDKLKELAQDQKKILKLQITARDFILPWGILYAGEDPNNPDPELFFGLRHIIEQIPLQQDMQVLDQEIDTRDGFSISLNVNRDIDRDMNQPFIARQIEFWQGLAQMTGRVSEAVWDKIRDVLNVIDGETDDQFLYFFCHAISKGLLDEGGPDRSRIILTDNQELTLEDMRFATRKLASHPVIFLNACESAELSPEFYDGFVPYFVSKGARGVIGTECETPAIFAEAFANRFFERFLKGEETLGEIFLDLRREFYFNDNNIMGLLYALYVDADTILTEPILA